MPLIRVSVWVVPVPFMLPEALLASANTEMATLPSDTPILTPPRQPLLLLLPLSKRVF